MIPTLTSKIAIASVATALVSFAAYQACFAYPGKAKHQDSPFYSVFHDTQMLILDELNLTAKQKASVDALMKEAAKNEGKAGREVLNTYYTKMQSVLSKKQYDEYLGILFKPNGIYLNGAKRQGSLIAQVFSFDEGPFPPKAEIHWQQELGATAPDKYVGPDGTSKTYWTGKTYQVVAGPGTVAVRARRVDGNGHVSDWGYQSCELTEHSPEQGAANTNARALARAVQANAIQNGKYNDNLADYAADLGGVLPKNPCTGTDTGYTIIVHNTPAPKDPTAQVSAGEGTLCGSWHPTVFSLTL